jgi:hypothetical protein
MSSAQLSIAAGPTSVNYKKNGVRTTGLKNKTSANIGLLRTLRPSNQNEEIPRRMGECEPSRLYPVPYAISAEIRENLQSTHKTRIATILNHRLAKSLTR